MSNLLYTAELRTQKSKRASGIEPDSLVWKTKALPIYHALKCLFLRLPYKTSKQSIGLEQNFGLEPELSSWQPDVQPLTPILRGAAHSNFSYTISFYPQFFSILLWKEIF
jgi:hypothetical protein